MPLAGRGERFVKAGYKTPKPLIEIEPGIPMFVRATNSFPLEMMSEIVFVILREHCHQYAFDAEIHKHYSAYNIRIVVLDGVTSGQAETVALALGDRPRNTQLLVFNGDSAFTDDLRPWLSSKSMSYDGALQVFRDTDSRWSYARIDANGNVVETAEKRVISNLASTGLYYFKSTERYLQHYEELEHSGGERYIAPIYNQMLKKGEVIGVIPCTKYLCFGTPSDYSDCRAGKFYTY